MQDHFGCVLVGVFFLGSAVSFSLNCWTVQQKQLYSGDVGGIGTLHNHVSNQADAVPHMLISKRKQALLNAN